jgi:hypothetical protein
MIVPDRLRLPLIFDAAGLAREVDRLVGDHWSPHFNQAIYEGDWSGVALRSVGGRPAQLYPDPTATGDFADTEVLAHCPLLRGALARLRCPTTAVRLLALGPGAIIAEHRDYRLGYDDGEVRLHIPIVSDPDVEFVLDGRVVDLRPGECWYLNLDLPHRVTNRSLRRRIHLVVDCIVDDWLKQLFDAALRSDEWRIHSS